MRGLPDAVAESVRVAGPCAVPLGDMIKPERRVPPVRGNGAAAAGGEVAKFATPRASDFPFAQSGAVS